MEEMIKLRLDKDMSLEEFENFLGFHQFDYETETDEVLDFDTLEKERVHYVRVPEERLEELKVMILVYRDLMVNRALRDLNISIENSALDYERTRKFNAEDVRNGSAVLVGEEESEEDGLGEELFAATSKGEAPTERDMEDSFYGRGQNKKNGIVGFEIPEAEEPEALVEELPVKGSGNGVLVLKILGWLIAGGVLVLSFILIR